MELSKLHRFSVKKFYIWCVKMQIVTSIFITDMAFHLTRGEFSLSNCREFGKNVIIFGVDNGSSTHIDDRKKDILILGKGSTQVLEDTILTAEPEYSINFSEQG